jgi:CRP/FNR family transcriptional regulator
MIGHGGSAGFSLFKEIPPALEAELRQHAREQVLPPRHVLFREGEEVHTFYFLEHGRIRMSVVLEDGEEHTINILREGDLFPHLGLLRGGTYPATAETLIEASVLALGRQDFVDLIHRHPELALLLLAEMGRRVEILQSRVKELIQKDLRLRVIHILLRLAREARSRRGGNERETRLDFHLTHEELARLAGAARESVTRILSEMRRQGLIAVGPGGEMIIREPELEKCISSS